MIKDLLKFSGRLLLVMLAVLFFTVLGLTLILSFDGISAPLKIVAGAFFLLFMFGLIIDSCAKWGAKDCKAVITYRRGRGTVEQLEDAYKQRYYPLKGFIAAAIPMIIPFIAVVICTVLQYRGWEKGEDVQLVGKYLYNVLFYAFMAYTPMLVLATPVCTTLTVVFGMPVFTADFNNFSQPYMVMPYMFFIPIVIFIAAAGIFYIKGFETQKNQVPAHMMPVYFPAKGQAPMDIEEAERLHEKENERRRSDARFDRELSQRDAGADIAGIADNADNTANTESADNADAPDTEDRA